MSGQRGFASWAPSAASEEILSMVDRVLDEYADHLPLTGRQIFYRLVGAFGYEKSDRAANRLYGVLGRARRSGRLSFDVIRDGGSSRQLPRTFDGAADFWQRSRGMWEQYSRDRQAGQPTYVELFCEAPGMMQQLVRVAFPFSVPVYGTRGFTGLGVVAEIARRALLRDVATVLLQIGDYDPSGESIFEAMSQDALTFVSQIRAALRRRRPSDARALATHLGLSDDEADELVGRDEHDWPELRPTRIALTAEQVESYELPTAPPSAKDSRSKSWRGETCQAEAMPPDLLAEVVHNAIEGRFDIVTYREEVGRERADRESIDALLKRAEGGDG